MEAAESGMITCSGAEAVRKVSGCSRFKKAVFEDSASVSELDLDQRYSRALSPPVDFRSLGNTSIIG